MKAALGRRSRQGSGGGRRNRVGVAPFVIYLTVLPAYRAACLAILKQQMADSVAIFASAAHLDPSVRTGVSPDLYQRVRILRIAKFAYIQLGHWRDVLAARSVMLDLNPRCISAWLLLFMRRALGRRTVVWGHLYGRNGAASRSAPVRRLMRRLANGFVAYTYDSRSEALRELPSQPVWVAPNALYDQETLDYSEQALDFSSRTNALYVGRLEREKKVDLAVAAFAIFAQKEPEARLMLIGSGSMEPALRKLVIEEGLEGRVDFSGWVNDVGDLRRAYETAFCSLSPGFIGLSLTQSMGFGVPLIAARDEPHSPEVELAREGGVAWCTSDSASSMAEEMSVAFARRSELPARELVRFVRAHYSAEAMAAGLVGALSDGSVGQ